MSQLVKLLRTAGRSTGRPAAGFGTHQETARKRLIVVAVLETAAVDKARQALEAGADAVEVVFDRGKGAVAKLKELAAALDAPVGAVLPGAVERDFNFAELEGLGLDYVKVEAGDVPASVFLLEGPAVVLDVRESFGDTMLKMLNFLPAKVVQVDAPDNIRDFSVKQLMEKRVDRELIGKPLLMKVGPEVRPESAKLLALVAPNGLVVPAADVKGWVEAAAELKEPVDADEDTGANISLRVPSETTARR